MGIRFPLKNVLGYNQTTENGAGVAVGNASTAGGVAKTFTIPQDTDNVVVKLTASIKGGGVSATFQTSDDGGTTWYDVARTSIVSNAGAATGTAEWLSVPVVGIGARTNTAIGSVIIADSVIAANGASYGAIGSSAASSLGVKAVSGLPIMGTYNRVFLRYTAAITSIINEGVQVYANSESQNG